METLPPLVLGEFQYVPKQKTVLLVFPSGDVSEFSTVESATAYLDNARRAGIPGAEQTSLFAFENGQWVQRECPAPETSTDP